MIGFVLFSSLSSAKLLYCCIPLVMTKLTAVMAAASTMTLESRAKRHRLQMDFQLPQKKQQELEHLSSAEGFLRCMALLMMIHAVCTFGCHATLKAFEQTSNLWPHSHPLSQKHLDCWHVLLHLHFLLPSHYTAHVLVHNKSTIAKGLIHRWVPPS